MYTIPFNFAPLYIISVGTIRVDKRLRGYETFDIPKIVSLPRFSFRTIFMTNAFLLRDNFGRKT